MLVGARRTVARTGVWILWMGLTVTAGCGAAGDSEPGQDGGVPACQGPECHPAVVDAGPPPSSAEPPARSGSETATSNPGASTTGQALSTATSNPGASSTGQASSTATSGPGAPSSSVAAPPAGASSSWMAGSAAPPASSSSWAVPGPADTRTTYPPGRTQSPITQDVVNTLQAIAASPAGRTRDPGVFMKVGDSITVNTGFLGCFAYPDFVEDYAAPEPYPWFNYVDLGGRAALRNTVSFFRQAPVGAATSFDRVSAAAQVGETAAWALQGAPSPVDQELAATNAAYAVIMYGSNDIYYGAGAGGAVDAKAAHYYANLLALVDALMARGVIPILTTMPPRTDDPRYLDIVPVFTGIARVIAQGRGIPLIDYHREMMALGAQRGFGLGPDGLHPTVAGYNAACHFSAADLGYGMNIRNLFTLQALDRVKRVMVDGAGPLDGATPGTPGAGSVAAPYVATGLPFADLRHTGLAPQATLASYGGCAGAPAAPGPENVYRLVLDGTTRLRAFTLEKGAHATHLYLLGDAVTGADCRAHADTMLATTLPAGTYHFVVDTLAADPAGAEYGLLLVACESGDLRCG